MVANKPSNGMEAEMAKTTTSNYDRDAAWGNDRINVHELATEILRQHNGQSIMTMADAVTRARNELELAKFLRHGEG